MANLGQKNGIFHVRFRFRSKEYKKSLKTKNQADARAALYGVMQTIHLITIGKLFIPPEVDPGDFILSGGSLQAPTKRRQGVPTFDSLREEYLQSQQHKIAASYLNSQRTHLAHFSGFLGPNLGIRTDRITQRELDQFLQERLAKRDPNTVCRERNTLLQFFRWTVSQGYLSQSPAAGLDPIPAGTDRPPFRTVDEIHAILARGGLDNKQQRQIWKCLFLAQHEIGELLAFIRHNQHCAMSLLLHAIPAYTGMRRGEVLRLTWHDVDLEQGMIYATSRKQSRRRRETRRQIDLHNDLCEELIHRKQNAMGQNVVCHPITQKPLTLDQANRIFWSPMRGTSWCLNSKKNWFKIGFHTYRHSFASNLAAAGIDQRLIDSMMGHQTEEMRKRYQHLFPKTRRAAIDMLCYDQPKPDARPTTGGNA